MSALTDWIAKVSAPDQLRFVRAVDEAHENLAKIRSQGRSGDSLAKVIERAEAMQKKMKVRI